MSGTENGSRMSGLVWTADLTCELDGDDGVVFFDRLFDILSERRRRSVLLHLQKNGEMTTDSLAAMVAADEEDATADTVAEDAVDSVRIELFHRHLPKLDDAGFVEYDAEAGVVSLSEVGERLDGTKLERTMR